MTLFHNLKLFFLHTSAAKDQQQLSKMPCISLHKSLLLSMPSSLPTLVQGEQGWGSGEGEVTPFPPLITVFSLAMFCYRSNTDSRGEACGWTPNFAGFSIGTGN